MKRLKYVLAGVAVVWGIFAAMTALVYILSAINSYPLFAAIVITLLGAGFGYLFWLSGMEK